LIWSTQRRKSAWAAFQSLQALGYQVITYTIWFVLALALPLVLLPVMLTEVRALAPGGATQDAFPFASMLLTWGVFLGLMAAYVGLGLLGAARTLLGREFHYPLLGRWLRRYVEYQIPGAVALNESRAELWIASMSHAIVILTIWGMFLPLAVWLTERDRSTRLRFQALQALLYQAAQAALFVVSYAVYTFALIALAAATLWLSASGSDAMQLLPVMLVAFLILLVFALLIALLLPLFQIFGQWAALRIAQGRDYRYPVLGRWLERRLANSRAEGE
jgi:uncharacterized Tic20 family protein